MPRKKKNDKPYADILIGAMLFVVVGIMPLVVRAVIHSVPPESFLTFFGMHDDGLYANVFSYVRQWFLLIPAIIIAFYYISDAATGGVGKINFKALARHPAVIAWGVFLLFTLISALFSDYRHTAWHGTMSRGEGTFVWLGYITVFFGTMYYIREFKHVRPILWGLIFSSIVMGAVGLSQFVQRDFFNTAWGEALVAGGVREYLANFSILFDFSYGTLYNPNTFGKYTSMAAPVLLIVAVTYDGNKTVNVLSFIGGALMLAGVFGSRSLGGAVGMAAAVGVLVVTLVVHLVYRLLKNKGKKPFTIKALTPWLVAAAIIAAIIISLFNVPMINQRVVLQWERFNTALRAQPRAVYDYIFDGSTMTVCRDDALMFSATVNTEVHPEAATPQEGDAWITVYDAQGETVPLAARSPAEGRVYYSFYVPEYGWVGYVLYEDPPHFRHRSMLFIREAGIIYGVTAAGTLIDMSQRVAAVGFRGREHWGSNRGYILSRSLGIMPRYAIVGSGADSFVNAFPQHDIVGKWQGMHNPYIVIDKAHNIYIHTWISQGGIAALALIFLFGFYLVTTFISLVRAVDERRAMFGLRLALLVGISAFCVGALATDSTIGSTGVFIVLLGLGYGLNAVTTAAPKQSPR